MFNPTQPEWQPLTRRRISRDEVQYFLDLYSSLASQRGVDVPPKLIHKVDVAKSKKSDDCRFSRLSLKKADLSDDQVKILALTLWQFPVLGTLDLRFNLISHHGVLALVELMRYQMCWSIEKPSPNNGPPVIDEGGAKLVCLHTIKVSGNPVDPNTAVVQELEFHLRIATGSSARLALWYAFDDNDRGHKGYLIPTEAQSAVYDVLGFATKHWTAAKSVLRPHLANENKITLPEFQAGLLELLKDKKYGGLSPVSPDKIREVAAWAATDPPSTLAFDVFPRRRQSSLGGSQDNSPFPSPPRRSVSGGGFLGLLRKSSSSAGGASSNDSFRSSPPHKRKGFFSSFSRHSEASERHVGGGGKEEQKHAGIGEGRAAATAAGGVSKEDDNRGLSREGSSAAQNVDDDNDDLLGSSSTDKAAAGVAHSLTAVESSKELQKETIQHQQPEQQQQQQQQESLQQEGSLQEGPVQETIVGGSGGQGGGRGVAGFFRHQSSVGETGGEHLLRQESPSRRASTEAIKGQRPQQQYQEGGLMIEKSLPSPPAKPSAAPIKIAANEASRISSQSPGRQLKAKSMERRVIFGHPVYTPLEKHHVEQQQQQQHKARPSSPPSAPIKSVPPIKSIPPIRSTPLPGVRLSVNDPAATTLSEHTINVLFSDRQQQQQQAADAASTHTKPARRNRGSVNSEDLLADFDLASGTDGPTPRPYEDLYNIDEGNDDALPSHHQQPYQTAASHNSSASAATGEDCQLTSHKLALRQIGFDSVDLTPTITRCELGQKLIHLDLSSNQLRSIDALALGFKALHTLRHLDLSKNCIEDMRCRNGHYPQRLEVLDLNHNYIPTIAGLETCRLLTTLNIAANHIRYVDGINHLRSLTALDISCNLISKPIGLRLLSLSTSVRELAIHGNPVSTESDCGKAVVITLMPDLEVLDGKKRPHYTHRSRLIASKAQAAVHMVGSWKPTSRSRQLHADEERSYLYRESNRERERVKAIQDQEEVKELHQSPPVPAKRQRKHIEELSQPKNQSQGIRRAFEMAFFRHQEVQRQVLSPKRHIHHQGNATDGNSPGVKSVSIQELLARSGQTLSPPRPSSAAAAAADWEQSQDQEALRRGSALTEASNPTVVNTPSSNVKNASILSVDGATGANESGPGRRTSHNNTVGSHQEEPVSLLRGQADNAQAILAQTRLEDHLVDIEQDIATTINAIHIALRIEEEGSKSTETRQATVEKVQSVCHQLGILTELVLPINLEASIAGGAIAKDGAELRLVNGRLKKANELKKTLNTLLQLMLREPEGSGAVEGFGIHIRDTYGLASHVRQLQGKDSSSSTDQQERGLYHQISIQQSLEDILERHSCHSGSVHAPSVAAATDLSLNLETKKASSPRKQSKEGNEEPTAARHMFSLTMSSDGESESHQPSPMAPLSTLSTSQVNDQFECAFLDSPEAPRNSLPVPVSVTSLLAFNQKEEEAKGGEATIGSPARPIESTRKEKDDDSGGMQEKPSPGSPTDDISVSSSYGTYDLPSADGGGGAVVHRQETWVVERSPLKEQKEGEEEEEDDHDTFAQRLEMGVTEATATYKNNLGQTKKELIVTSAAATDTGAFSPSLSSSLEFSRDRATSSPISFGEESTAEEDGDREKARQVATAPAVSGADSLVAEEEYGEQHQGEEMDDEWVESYDETYQQLFYHNEKTGVSQWTKPDAPYLPFDDYGEEEEDELHHHREEAASHHHHHHHQSHTARRSPAPLTSPLEEMLASQVASQGTTAAAAAAALAAKQSSNLDSGGASNH